MRYRSRSKHLKGGRGEARAVKYLQQRLQILLNLAVLLPETAVYKQALIAELAESLAEAYRAEAAAQDVEPDYVGMWR